MNEQRRVIDTPQGPIMLRPEKPEDEAFLLRLFDAARGSVLRLGGVPEPMATHLVAMQHRAQTQTYRGMFPQAAFSIIDREGAPIGRMIEDEEADAVHIVDIALLPQFQAKGIGTALMRALREQWTARGRGARAMVAFDNEPSLKLFRKLGFVQTGPDEMPYLRLRWSPPAV
jgi:ribosomal protein S18 acetylase RimI-like enzyme